MNLMPPHVARTTEGGQDARTGCPTDGINIPVPVTPLVTTSRRHHPDEERLAGEPRSYAPLFNQQQLHQMELMQSGARVLYPNVLPGPTPPKTPMPPRPDSIRRPDFPRAEEVKRQRDSWFQDERVRDLAWRQNEELHRALQDVREENEELRRENAMLREELANAEKMLDPMRFRTPEGSRGDQGSGHEKRAIDAEQKGSHCPPEGAAPNQPSGEQRESTRPLEGEVPNQQKSADAETTQQDATLKIMLGLMQGMQEIQKKMLEKHEDGDKEEDRGESETVRNGVQPLPLLQEWSATSGPIDLNDWLILIEPEMSNLSRTSGDWWHKLLSEARAWYEAHMKLAPLQRINHSPTASDELAAKKWQRLERRASTLLLNALPMVQRKDLISSKKIKALDIVCSLLVAPAWRPGPGARNPSLHGSPCWWTSRPRHFPSQSPSALTPLNIKEIVI